METQLQYKLPVFEGPLDLLLSLIAKNKIDIYDIQISDLLDQYMEQISRMQENQMDIASEFLTMASRLVYIKSVMLLPKYEEEAEELKKELSGQLLEYAVCREIAAKLGTIYDFDTFFREASPVEFDLTYNRSHPPEDIAKAYVSAVGASGWNITKYSRCAREKAIWSRPSLQRWSLSRASAYALRAREKTPSCI